MGLHLKILILGTSNSILKQGWVAGLRAALPDALIENQSVGASPGIQFGQKLSLDFAAYDLVFFDSLVNDENLLPYVGDEKFLNRIIYEIISTIAQQTPLIVLGFSAERYLGRHSDLYQTRRRLALMCGAQFIGIHELVEQFGPRILPHQDKLFDETAAHPRIEIQNLIGHELGRVLPEATPLLRRTPSAENHAHLYSTETLASLAAAGKILAKSNSLMRQIFIALQPSAALDFQNPGLCLGLNVDAFGSRALVAMQYPGGRRLKEIWFFADDNGLQLQFVAIRHGIHLQRLTVLDEPAFPEDLRSIEASPHSRFNASAPRTGMKLNFASALFWSGNPEAELPAAPADVSHTMALHQKLQAALETRLMASQP